MGLWLVGNVGSIACSSVGRAIGWANVNLSRDRAEPVLPRFATSNLWPALEPTCLKYDMALAKSSC